MTASAKQKPYHYELLEKNRARVREQGASINRALKVLRSISDTAIPVARGVEASNGSRDDEPTQQFVTLPAIRAVDQRLKIALEEAEAARDSSPAPAPAHKKKWYRWPD